MKTTMSPPTGPHPLYSRSECWIARGIALLVNSFFLIVLFLTLTDKDSAVPPFWPAIVCVVICMLGLFVAMRWEQAGGRIAIAGAGALVLVNLCAALFTELGWHGIVSALVYAVPFFLAGSLFVSGARQVGR
jgi:hypothetical protein